MLYPMALNINYNLSVLCLYNQLKLAGQELEGRAKAVHFIKK